MRPLGHTQAREEREAHASVDDRLQTAWEAYLIRTALYRNQQRAKGGVPTDDADLMMFRFAVNLLRPLNLSLATIQQLLLVKLPDIASYESRFAFELCAADLGLFVSAGYQCVPEQEIDYCLDTPHLGAVGAYLDGKHLRITGNVGEHAGRRMMGTLTVEGNAGISCGEEMIGTFINNGHCGRASGRRMFGYFQSKQRIEDTYAIGRWNGRWNIPLAERKAFRKDITNSFHLSHDELYRELDLRYRR